MALFQGVVTTVRSGFAWWLRLLLEGLIFLSALHNATPTSADSQFEPHFGHSMTSPYVSIN